MKWREIFCFDEVFDEVSPNINVSANKVGTVRNRGNAAASYSTHTVLYPHRTTGQYGTRIFTYRTVQGKKGTTVTETAINYDARRTLDAPYPGRDYYLWLLLVGYCTVAQHQLISKY